MEIVHLNGEHITLFIANTPDLRADPASVCSVA